jgi:hypothetical protein
MKPAEYRVRLGAMQMAGAFALLFLVLYLWHRAPAGPLFLYLATGCLAAAVFFYRLLTPVFRLWMRFGTLLNRVIAPLVFGLLFYVVLTPMALLRRLFGGRSMPTGFARAGESAWVQRRQGPLAPAEFERPY